MYQSSLDAVRSALTTAFPTTTQYVDAVPADFDQPSFFVDHVTSGTQDLNRVMVQFDIQWQIVYFPPLKKSGVPDKMNALSALDQLCGEEGAFTKQPFLTSPDGTVFHIEDVSGGPRDDELYVSIKLSAQFNRTLPDYELMKDIHLEEG